MFKLLAVLARESTFGYCYNFYCVILRPRYPYSLNQSPTTEKVIVLEEGALKRNCCLKFLKPDIAFFFVHLWSLVNSYCSGYKEIIEHDSAAEDRGLKVHKNNVI